MRLRTLPSLVATLLALNPFARSQVVAYHDVSSASHQTQFANLSGQGYRLKQLSVAGGLASQRYSAIWELQGGPAWVASHAMTQAQYTSQRTTWLGQGYRPKLVTAAGSGADTVFAAMFVADGVGYNDVTAATENQLGTAINTARIAGRAPCAIDLHGTAAAPLFCAVFETAPASSIGFDVVHDANSTDFAETFNGYYGADARLAALGMSDSQRYVSVWFDDRVGNWAARANYTSSGWLTQSATLVGQGLSPLVIASGGSGSSLRFAGSFAAERTPRTRMLTTTGLARPEFQSFDTYMTGLVQSTGARNASIAIAKDGRLVYARGYTSAEAGTTITQPTTNFRLASCAKVLTSLAIHKLDATTPLALSNRPQQLLGLAPTGGHFDNVTLLQCLEYTSGLTRNYDGNTIAEWAPGAFVLPTTHALAVDWLRVQPVDFTPGTFGEYTNSSFLLAAQVVRHLTGTSLHGYLQANLYGPLGITRARVAASEVAALTANELKGYTRFLGLAESDRHTDRRRVAKQWSADLSLADGSGGMSMSTVDYVRLLAGVFGLGVDGTVMPPIQQGSMLARHTFPEFDEGPGNVTPGAFSWWQRPNGVWAYNKSGTLSDASPRVIWRTDGIAIAVFINKGDSWPDFDELNLRAEAVASWPTDDLFPNYGLATFPRRPRLDSVNVTTLPNVTNTPFVLTGERLDTVTSVALTTATTTATITATTTANWHDGWFRILSPTQLEVFIPQGRPSGAHGLSVSNTVGTSSGLFVQLISSPPGVPIAAPPTVTPGQSFRVYCGAGGQPTLSLAALVISTSNLPSTAPGIVDLGIGNQFSDVIVADFQVFDPVTRATWWPIPPLPWLQAHVQCAVFDPVSATPFPLPTSGVRTIVRS